MAGIYFRFLHLKLLIHVLKNEILGWIVDDGYLAGVMGESL